MNDSNDSHSTDPWLESASGETSIGDSVDENERKFNDNFEPQLAEEVPKSSSQVMSNPLPDSHQYIQSLERKLETLKGRTKEMSTKDLMNSLSTKRSAIIQQLLHSSDGHHYEFGGQTHDSDITSNSALYQYFERRLFPQTQALTEEELQSLLESDLLQRLDTESQENGKQ